MTPIERQILKSLKFIITELNNECRETSLDERLKLMGEIDGLLSPKGADEDACDMSNTKFYQKGKDVEDASRGREE